MTVTAFDSVRPPEPPRDGRRRRRRRDGAPRTGPDWMVPAAELTSYYGQNIVKPAPWEEAIAIYLWAGGMAAGSGLVGAGADITHRHVLRRNARIAGLVSLGVGGTALVVDLGRPERFLNMMRTAKLTSPMSVGSWILVGFSGFTGGAAALEIIQPFLPRESWWRELVDVASIFASAGAAFFAPPLAAYTAVLFSDTATPLWHQAYREMPFLFVASGQGAGCGLNMVLGSSDELRPVRQLAAVAAACDLAADAAMERRLGEEGQPLHEGRAGRLHKAAKVLTAVGGVTAALAGRNRDLNVLAGASLVAGSACTRFSIYYAGLESAKDPVYTVRPQRRRFAEKLAQGRSVTEPGGEWPEYSIR